MDSTQTEEQRGRSRVSIRQPVRLRYRLFQDFIQEVSSNISVGGMFIATEDPQETGSQFEFELALEDGFSLVKGQAEVVWVRSEAVGLGHPAGMGVRFLELEGASQSLVAKIVDKHRKKGRTPFDVDSEEAQVGTTEEQLSSIEEQLPSITEITAEKAPPAVPSDEETVVTVAEVYEPDGEALFVPDLPPVVAQQPPRIEAKPRRVLRVTLLSLIAIGAGLIIVLLFNHFYVRPRIDDLERRLKSLSALGADTSAPSDEITGEKDLTTGAGEDTALDLQDPLNAVREWARAWSEQRVDDYLGTYSSQFDPAGEMNRQEWESLRRTRILRASGIRVQVLLAEESEIGPGETRVSFVQAYRSDSYQDRVRKVLRLVWEEEVWKIVEEQVVRALPD